jgi:hypothetical protein
LAELFERRHNAGTHHHPLLRIAILFRHARGDAIQKLQALGPGRFRGVIDHDGFPASESLNQASILLGRPVQLYKDVAPA